MTMQTFYPYPIRSTPKHAGIWWLPGLGGDPILTGIDQVEQGLPRLRTMYKDGVVVMDEATIAANQAFFEWWKIVDPITFAANAAAATGEAAMTVPKVLFEFWQASAGALEVPAAILGKGLNLGSLLVMGGIGLGLYWLLSKPAPQAPRQYFPEEEFVTVRRLPRTQRQIPETFRQNPRKATKRKLPKKKRKGLNILERGLKGGHVEFANMKMIPGKPRSAKSADLVIAYDDGRKEKVGHVNFQKKVGKTWTHDVVTVDCTGEKYDSNGSDDIRFTTESVLIAKCGYPGKAQFKSLFMHGDDFETPLTRGRK